MEYATIVLYVFFLSVAIFMGVYIFIYTQEVRKTEQELEINLPAIVSLLLKGGVYLSITTVIGILFLLTKTIVSSP